MPRPALRIFILLVFALVSAGIGFFHTESGPAGRSDCPACQFLTSSISTAPGLALVMPALSFQGQLVLPEPLRPGECPASLLAPRSPPRG